MNVRIPSRQAKSSSENQKDFLVWNDVTENLWFETKKRNALTDIIQEYFHSEWIDSSEITDREILEQENFLVIQTEKQEFYFDIYSEKFCWNTLSEAQTFRENNPSNEIKIMQTGIPVLQKLMQKNSQSWGLFHWNAYLDDRDIVDFDTPEAFAWKNAKEVQMMLRQNIQVFEWKWWLLWVSEIERKKIAEYYKLYMEIVMWIWEEFEDGSGYFYVTEWELDTFARTSIYAFWDFESCIDYYTDIQTRIFDNINISKKNKEAHKLISEKLAQIIFERFQRDFLAEENPEIKQELLMQWIDFARVITERKTSSWEKVDINNALRNPGLAQEICAFVLARKNGIFETLENSEEYDLNFRDPVVWDRSPEFIINSSKEKLKQIWIPHVDSFLRDDLWISLVVLVQTENFAWDYESLSFEHKREVSLLARFLKKIDSWELSPQSLIWKTPAQIQAYIIWLAKQIESEAQIAVENAYDRNFDIAEWQVTWKFSDKFKSRYWKMLWSLEKIGAKPADIEALKVFNSIRGNDGRVWWNYSDENLNTTQSVTKATGVILATIIVVMAATAWAWFAWLWPLASIAVWASSGTVASFWILDPRKHDSRAEMLTDISTDFAINTFHAVYMEKLTLALWGGSSFWQKAGLIWWDLWSGVWIEFLREWVLDKIFHSRAIVDQKREGFDEYFRLNYSLRKNIWDEIKKRFEQASEYYYAWENEDLNILEEVEFKNIDFQKIWKNNTELKTAIIEWCERQEKRMEI